MINRDYYEERNNEPTPILDKLCARPARFTISLEKDNPHTQDKVWKVKGLREETVTLAGMPQMYKCTCANFARNQQGENDQNKLACVHISAVHQDWRLTNE